MHRGRRTFARWRAKGREWRRRAPSRRTAKKPRVKMPLIVVANSPDKDAALAGLERWKSQARRGCRTLAVDDVLVDSMRGRSSTWTRIRVNLRHVPEELRPAQETPDPDDDPTREWRSMTAKAQERTVQPRSAAAAEDCHAIPAAAPLRAAHRCSRAASCPCAIGGNAPCGGSGCPACARTRLRPRVPAAAAPRTGPCPGSSGSGRPACAARLRAPDRIRPALPWMIGERVLAIRREEFHQLPALLRR